MILEEIYRFIQNYKRLVILFSVLLFTDLFLKYIFWLILPLHTDVNVIQDEIYFYVILNKFSACAVTLRVLEGYSINTWLFIGALCCFTLGSYIFYIKDRQIEVVYKILIGYSILSILLLTIPYLKHNVDRVEFSAHFISWFTKVCGIYLAAAFWSITDNKTIKVLWTLIIAGGIGNFLSHFIPPFNVIDYLYVKSFDDAVQIGVFNFADVVLICGTVSFIVYGGVKAVSTAYSFFTLHKNVDSIL